ncbi:hypothetical protein D3C80_1831620 [compost metagenome]
MTNPFHGLGQGLSQARAATAVALKQLQCHALSGFLADAGQDAQGIDQLANQGTEAHGQ